MTKSTKSSGQDQPSRNQSKSQSQSRPQNKTHHLLARLAAVESPDTTFLPQSNETSAAYQADEADEADQWPIVMKKAAGSLIRDVEGKRFVDMTACFGVLALGHRHKVTMQAIRKQSARLIHGMGDVHPSEAKIKFLETLAKHSPYESPRIILGQSGADAIEAAMKTALLVTGKRRFLVFSGAYHGLSVGAMQLTTRAHFRTGFEKWTETIAPLVQTVPFPLVQNVSQIVGVPLSQSDLHDAALGEEHCTSADQSLEIFKTELRIGDVAGVFIEPIQGRAGERTFPAGYVAELKKLCNEHGTLLIADEIFTGYGRTGLWFGMEHHGVTPDLLCVGKVIGGGFPMSACIGNAVAEWPQSTGEARHTSTFLGHPLTCAVGNATVTELVRIYPQLQIRLSVMDTLFAEFLGTMKKRPLSEAASFELRGSGWMRGFWFYRAEPGFAANLAKQLLAKGFVTLPSGPTGRVLSWTPPLNLEPAHLKKFLKTLGDLLDATK
jgi:4-aminobutyrate aminotransferase-like enzyme